MKKDASTEEKIKEAARQVFMAKGFAGCSSREISKAAGMNVALVNYYFRSKSQLFQIIFETAMEDFVASMMTVFSSDQSIESKMRVFIEQEYEFLAKHPELPVFIITEMNRKEGCSIDHAAFYDKIAASGIFNECTQAQAAGKMRKINILSLTLLIMSNCQYPIMARSLMQGIHGLTEEEYTENLLIHKHNVTEMLVNYLFPINSKNN